MVRNSYLYSLNICMYNRAALLYSSCLSQNSQKRGNRKINFKKIGNWFDYDGKQLSYSDTMNNTPILSHIIWHRADFNLCLIVMEMRCRSSFTMNFDMECSAVLFNICSVSLMWRLLIIFVKLVAEFSKILWELFQYQYNQ